MDEAELAKAWSDAHVANLMSINDSDSGEVYGAFAITDDLLQIFSLDPEEDYEVNPNTITAWRMLFPPEGETIGYAEYRETLKALEPYILAKENGSILVRKLTKTELEQVFTAAGGKTGNSLVL